MRRANFSSVTGMVRALDPGAGLGFWRRFQTRLLLWLILLSVATSAVAGYIFYRRQLQFVQTEQRRRGSTLISNLAGQSELGAYAGDRSFLIGPVRRAFLEPDVVFVSIYDRRGKRLISMSKPDAPASPRLAPGLLRRLVEVGRLPRPLQRSDLNHIDFLAPISSVEADGEQTLFGGATRAATLGVAQIGLSREPARQKLREVLWAGIQVSLVILAMSGLLALFLSRRLSKPVLALAQGADRLRSGGLGYQIEVRRSDELGLLAESFNRMSAQLRETVDSLNHLNRNLEAEVSRRTVALRRSRDFVALLNAPLQLNNLLDTTLQALLRSTGARAGAIYLAEGIQLDLAVTQGALASTFTLESGLARELTSAAQKKEATLAPADPARAVDRELGNLAGLLHLPLRYRDRLQGIVTLALDEPLARDQLDFVEHAGSQLAIAVSNARAYASVEHLARELEQRNVALLQQRDQLQEVNRLKSEFLAGVSHELRTPLNAIIGYTELINEGIYGPTTPEQHQSLEGIAESANSLLELISQILDLSKVEAGRMTTHFSEVDLAHLTREIMENTASLAKDRPYELQAELPDEPVRVVTDGPKIRQILVNLISNAIKFTDVGSVVIRLTPLAKDGARIAVVDTGIGIREADQQMIFDEFRQVDGSSTRKHGGTGLGLAISRKLATLVGARIELSSRPGQGSTFTLVLPGSRVDAGASLPELAVAVDERPHGEGSR